MLIPYNQHGNGGSISGTCAEKLQGMLSRECILSVMWRFNAVAARGNMKIKTA